jgi:crotonobetainyl-CoA:carnitine CoA-transferase CaiB-like acyl-CoA transferase
MSFQPLAETLVVDLTSSLAGPYCTQILAALGADVVKVEHPVRGDETREWGPPFWGGEGAIFLAANSGKRSIGLDFRRPEGMAALLRLVDRADVFVQSLRPGRAERLGLGADELRAKNPRLVYCSIGAFGRIGPRRKQPGYDPLMQAAGGVISVTGDPDRPGVRVGVSIVDQSTAMWAAIGIVVALWERERSGEGRVVDVALYETAIGLVAYHLIGYLASGVTPRRHGTSFPLIVPYQVFSARDGELMVAAANDRLFRALCEALGLPGLAEDARFATNPERVTNRDELVPLLAAAFAAETVATWLERLEAAGVPAAPVQDLAQVAVDEQTRAAEILQPLDHAKVADLTGIALPLSADGRRVLHRSAPPLLGEHTAAVLAESGYSPGEVAELAEAGVVRLGNGPAR